MTTEYPEFEISADFDRTRERKKEYVKDFEKWHALAKELIGTPDALTQSILDGDDNEAVVSAIFDDSVATIFKMTDEIDRLKQEHAAENMLTLFYASWINGTIRETNAINEYQEALSLMHRSKPPKDEVKAAVNTSKSALMQIFKEEEAKCAAIVSQMHAFADLQRKRKSVTEAVEKMQAHIDEDNAVKEQNTQEAAEEPTNNA